MKIYSALFIALVASHNGLFADVSAAADTASAADRRSSHPHLRALTDVANPCGEGQCRNDNHCSGGVCVFDGGADCGTCTRTEPNVCAAESHCDSNGVGCPINTHCDLSFEDPQGSGCYGCNPDLGLKFVPDIADDMIEQEVEADNEEVDPVDTEDEKEAKSLRASILEEE